MIGALTSVFLAILIGWMVYALAGFAVSAPVALSLGVVIGVLSVLMFRDTLPVRGAVALLGPIGVVLPLLALRHVAAGVSMPLPAFGMAELLVFLVAYMGFLAASMGVLPVDPYRLGYAPVPVGIMVLGLCAYGAMSGNFFVPLVAVAGQALWVAGWGSSNWFDHVLHASLVPVVIVVLVLRLL